MNDSFFSNPLAFKGPLPTPTNPYPKQKPKNTEGIQLENWWAFYQKQVFYYITKIMYSLQFHSQHMDRFEFHILFLTQVTWGGGEEKEGFFRN